MSFAIKVILVLLSVILLEVYFVKRVKGAFKFFFPKVSNSRIKILKWIILIFINIYPIFTIFSRLYSILGFGGRFNLPENIFFDYLVLYPFWVGTMIIVQSTLFFLFIEIFNLVLIPFVKSNREFRKKIISVLILIIAGAAFIYVPIRILYDYKAIEINEYFIEKKNLPKVLDGFKITFISDVQADRYTNNERLTNFIDKTNSTNPDLILMAGDIITGTPNYINTSAEYLGRLKSKHGIYTCVGDHDNWAYRGDNRRSLREITEALANVGIPMINNNKLTLGIDSANIEVTFATNTYVETINGNTLESLTNNNGKSDLRIFLTHQPRQFMIDKAIEKNYDLFLAGHTHGGQITFLFPFYNLSPTMIETPYMRGRFDFESLSLIVTRGLGMSLSPVRFNSTPEITVIKLTSGK